MESPLLRMYLFGEPRFEWNARPHAFSAPPKTLPLLAYLLLNRRHAIARETLAAALWPDVSDREALANVRRHLHYAGKALPPVAEGGQPWLLLTPKTVSWNAGSSFWLDLDAYEAESGDERTRAHAVRLYGGDLYQRCDEEWLFFERERLRTLQLSNLTYLFGHARERGRYLDAVQYAQMMLAIDPWREDALRGIVDIRALLGDRAGALAEYERFARRLEAELGVEPAPETHALYDRIRSSVARSSVSESARVHPLVGRANEVAMLREHWQHAKSERSSLVLIGGEAGVGKTALLRAFCDVCTDDGGSAYVGNQAPEAGAPYGAFADILSQAGGTMGALFSDSTSDRLQAFEAVTEFLAARAQKDPLLIALEDLHWAGAATLDLLRYMFTRLSGTKLLLIGTYREDEVDRAHPLRALRRNLAHTGRLKHIALSTLSRDDVRTLARMRLRHTVDDALLENIYERAGGNPLFVLEMLHQASEIGSAGIPQSINELVATRLLRLDERTRFVVEAAAIAGTRFSVDLIAQVTGLPEREMLDAIDRLIELRFFRQTTGAADAFSFGHELIRAAIYDQVPSEARTRSHARVALAMRDLYANHFDDVAASVARHFEIGTRFDEAARAYAQAAASALAVHALDEARVYADKATQLANDDKTRYTALCVLESLSAQRCDLTAQEQFADRLWEMRDRLDDAQMIDVLCRRVDFFSATNDSRERAALDALAAHGERNSQFLPSVLIRTGRYAARSGDVQTARAQLARAMEISAERADAEGIIAASTALIKIAIDAGEPVGQQLTAVRATLGDTRDPRVEAHLAFAQGRALVERDPRETYEQGTIMLQHARTAGDLWLEALALRTMGAAAVYCMRVRDAREHLRRCAELTALAGRPYDLAVVRNWQLMAENRTLDYAAALELGSEGLRTAEACGAADLRIRISGNLATADHAAGNFESALSRLIPAFEETQARGYHGIRDGLLNLIGVIDVSRGRIESGIAALERSTRTAADLVILSLALLAAGRTAQAASNADALRARTLELQHHRFHPQTYLYAAAHLFHFLEDGEHARALADLARRRFDEIAAELPDEARPFFERFRYNNGLIALSARGQWKSDPLQVWFTAVDSA